MLGKLLTKKSADRYSSASKLAQDLERVARGEAPKFAELDPSKWPFKSKPPANKGSGANAVASIGVARHRSDSAPFKTDRAEKPDVDQASKASIALSDRSPRVGRRGLRSGQESSVPAGLLVLGGVVLAVLLIALSQSTGSSDRSVKSHVASAKEDSKVAPPENPPVAETLIPLAQPSKPAQHSAPTPAQPLDSGTMQELEELGRARAYGGGGTTMIDTPQVIQTSVAAKPSIASCLSEARAKLDAADFKEALKRAEDIR